MEKKEGQVLCLTTRRQETEEHSFLSPFKRKPLITDASISTIGHMQILHIKTI